MTGVHVMLMTLDRAMAARWLSSNSSWIRQDVDVLTLLAGHPVSVCLVEQLFHLVLDIQGVATPLHGTAIDNCFESVRERSEGRSLLICDTAATASPFWRDVVERAYKVRPTAAFGGRWIGIKEGPAKEPIEIDDMPRMVAPHVIEWSFSHQIHGVVTARLPKHFIWIPALLAGEFLMCLRMHGEVSKALESYFRMSYLRRRLPCAYLSDLLVYKA